MNKHLWILIIAGIISVCVITTFGIVKLNTLQYNALDLGIYSQVFWNTSHGNFFDSSIQDTHYLGDHIELWIIPLSLLYRILPSPLTLIVLQALAVFICPLLLYLIARRFLSPIVAFWASIIFLLNPILWNMALFEFHMLVFAVPLLLLLFYFYFRRSYGAFVIVLVSSLLIREDVALIIFGVGLLALIEKRSLRWWLIPLLSSIVWFLAAMFLSHYFSAEGYKFFSYYDWLGSSPSAILSTIFHDPIYVLRGIFSIQHILLTLGLLLIFLGFPLRAPKTLIVGVFIFAQLILAQFSTTTLFQTHYTALLLPVLAISALQGLKKMLYNYRNNSVYRDIAILSGSVVVLFLFTVLGPGYAAAKNIFHLSYAEKNAAAKTITSLPPDAAILASYGTIPTLASREHLSTLHYAVPGIKQFSRSAYTIDPKPTYVVMQLSDFTFLELALQSPVIEASREISTKNFRDLLGGYALTSFLWDVALLSHTDDATTSFAHTLIADAFSGDQQFSCGPLTITAWESTPLQNIPNNITLTLTAHKLDPTERYAVTISQNDKSYTAPLAWNLYTPEELNTKRYFNMTIPLPFVLADASDILVTLTTITGYVNLSGLRSLQPQISQTEIASVILPHS